MGDDFSKAFEALTGHSPLSWQTRLYNEHFAKGDLPSVIDIPTGLGKTMVMAAWLIARYQHPEKVPTRLIYVVDRRTVVDQATDLAEKLVKNWREKNIFDGDPPAISTLRGQLADNREWSTDPSRPAIIIGTVDLIGSALLFSGYRSSYKRRPLEAGLLGQDSLLVLDEAHLSKPFEKLICAINSDGQFQKNSEGSSHGKPMRVIRMSATSAGSTDSKPFTLQLKNGNLTGDDAKDKEIAKRFGAKKRLTVEVSTDPIVSIANVAGKIAAKHPGSRFVIFVKSPKDVEAVRKSLIKKDKSRESKIAQLTGTMRGLERDELVDLKAPIQENQHGRRVMQRFLKPENDPFQGECFLLSTSAGEVGFDLNADHLVGDTSPLDSWIQRLGRVNRRGNGDATVVLVKEKEPADKSEFDKACVATLTLLTEGMDVSPKELAAFKNSLTSEQVKEASTPEPTMVELTDILLDAWSMTSISAPLPGRPEVGPWIRGIADDSPQTTIAWRAELELFQEVPKPRKAFKAIFDKHSVRPHESLTTYSYRVVEFLKLVTRPKGGRPELRNTRVLVKLSRDVLIKTVGELIDDDRILYADPMLILPASFGGLDEAGMLSPDNTSSLSLDVADELGYEPRKDSLGRLRILIERTDDDRWKVLPLPGGATLPVDFQLDQIYETSTKLFNALKGAGFRIRLVQPVAFDKENEAIRSIVLLAPVSKDKDKIEQTLIKHVGAVETEARRIADELDLNDPVRSALIFAAQWHDEGKKAEIWQRFIGGPDKSGELLGKAATTRDPKLLKGYRHEFGSLLQIHHPDRLNTECVLLADPETCDIALHLIATHHGFGRPHFDTLSVKGFTTTECEAIHIDAIRRFARLQRRCGHWYLAWFENLLRCADAMASADSEAEDDPVESSETAGGAR